jgi:phospholipase/carboxylesterase
MILAKGRTGHFAALLLALIALAGLCAACSSIPDPDEHRFAQPWPFYLYLPATYTPDRAWPLFIGVSGSSADGRSCWNTWQQYADEKEYVLLCPELADPDGQLEQLRGNARLLDILGRVYEECSLQPKIFLAGFSAGGQFVHGYAFMNPTYVVGVSVIATGNYYQPPPSARHIPFIVIVGDRDDPGNVENAKQLARLLGQGGYSVELQVIAGEGHTISKEAIQLTLALFDRTVGND